MQRHLREINLLNISIINIIVAENYYGPALSVELKHLSTNVLSFIPDSECLLLQ